MDTKQEDWRKLREKNKALEKAMKVVSKTKGYKSIKEIRYKIIDGFLYAVFYTPTLIDENVFCPRLCIDIHTKPLILNEIFWKVFGMYDLALKQPESFHIKGTFTARGVDIDKFYQDYFEEENQEVVAENILEKTTLLIENSRKKIFDIATFETFIYEKPNQELNKILISIIKQDYFKAENLIDYCISNKICGGFRKGDSWKSIIECAKEYINGVRSNNIK